MNISAKSRLSGLLCLAVTGLLALLPCTKALCQSAFDINSPTFLDLNLRASAVPDYVLDSEGGYILNPEEEPSNQIDFDLKFPVVIKQRWQLIGIAGYKTELVFDQWDPMEDDLLTSVFHRFSINLLTMHELQNDWFFWGGVRANIQSASPITVDRSVDANGLLLFGKKWENGKLGLGVNAGRNIFGRATVVPLLAYKQEWNRGWSIDALLPSSVQLNKSFSEKHRLFLSLQGSNANYRYSRPRFINGKSTDQLSYRRLTVRSILGYERLVAGPLGLGAEAGLERALRFGIYDQTGLEKLHDYGNSFSPYFNVKLFMVVPGGL